MPRHIINSGNQSISGNLTVSGNVTANNLVYTGDTGAFYPTTNPSGYVLSSQTGAYTGSFYPLGSNPSGYILPSQTGAFYPTTNPSGYVLSSQTGAYTGSFYPLGSNPSGYLSSISDGSITPAKLSTGAPSWDTGGNVTISVNSSSPNLNIQSDINTITRYPALRLTAYGSGSNGVINFFAAEGSASSPSAVLNAKTIGQMVWSAYGASGFDQVARFSVTTAQDHSSGNAGVVMRWATTASGSTAEVERMRISENGALLVNTTADVASSCLTLGGTTKGLRLNVVTTAQRTGIANTNGLVLYDSSLSKIYASSASTWFEQADISSSQTLTNKRLTPRITTITSAATPTVNTDNCDMVKITALAVAITSMTTNLSGSPSDGDQLLYRIKDNGSPRGITWGASFQAMGAALPTTTVASKTLHVMFIWDSVEGKWGCISTAQQA